MIAVLKTSAGFSITAAVLLLFLLSGERDHAPARIPPEAGRIPQRDSRTDVVEKARERLIEEQLVARGLTDERVLSALRAVPRHRFLPPELLARAWSEGAIRRPDGEILPAPDISGFLLRALELSPGDRVLVTRTRSGWLTALVAELAGEVVTVAATEGEAEQARRLLGELGYENVTFHVGDPTAPPPVEGDFQAILLTGAVEEIPVALYRRLAPGGRILAPVGRPPEFQTLIRVRRGEDEPRATEPLLTVSFGPLVR